MIDTALAGGRYRIERELARGGMAIVYLGRDEELGRPVAVKVLADNLAGDASIRERFVREARVAAGLAHPNIVTVFDTGEEDGRPFIVMEYVEGRTLANRLRDEGKLAWDEAVAVAAQVCAGLEHAHAAGLVHRDVKPGNLLERSDGTIKIADFGIARITEGSALTEVGTILGTAAYLAPEQAAGRPVTAAADIYSLGAVLYEAIAGRPPYEAATLAELVARQQEQALRPLRELEPTVPARLDELVSRCLSNNPRARPPSAGDLRGELGALGPDADTRRMTVSERPTVAVAPGRHLARARGRVVPFALAAVGVLALVLALAAMGGEDGRTDPPPVEAVPRADTPAERARNLADWLRENAR